MFKQLYEFITGKDSDEDKDELILHKDFIAQKFANGEWALYHIPKNGYVNLCDERITYQLGSIEFRDCLATLDFIKRKFTTILAHRGYKK